jgi:hypothetical protein
MGRFGQSAEASGRDRGARVTKAIDVNALAAMQRRGWEGNDRAQE